MMLIFLWSFTGFLLFVDSDSGSEFVLAGDYLHCENNPCQYGGTCMSHGNSYTCLCKQGHYGVNCHLDADECRSNPCLNGGTCEDQENSYICHCGPEYSGTYCEMVNSTNGSI